MGEIYTTGRWKPSPGHEEAFIEAWQRFASWASAREGAGELHLTRDVRSDGVFVSFGAWEGEETVRSWKNAPDFRERLARVLQHADDFEPAELEVVATAGSGAASDEVTQAAKEKTMALQIGDMAPDFEAETTEGPIRFHDWIGDSWAVLFSHPKDFTPVCTTELGYMAKIRPELERRNVKVLGLSVDSTGDHERWAKDIEETQGHAPNYPIIGDSDYAVSKLFGMLPSTTSGDPKARTPADNQTVRNVFVVGPDKKIKLILVYPMTTGRNFDEVLRVIDSLQLTATHKVATPVNWHQGDDVIIAGSVSDDEARERFGDWDSPKPYIRIVPQPGVSV